MKKPRIDSSVSTLRFDVSRGSLRGLTRNERRSEQLHFLAELKNHMTWWAHVYVRQQFNDGFHGKQFG